MYGLTEEGRSPTDGRPYTAALFKTRLAVGQVCGKVLIRLSN